MSKVYIAGPFFNAEQVATIEEIKCCLDIAKISYYSPKDDNLFFEGCTRTPKEGLTVNCDEIRMSDMVIAVTDGKDVGTMWECGYAFANGIKILYVWLSRQPGQNFNLMLAASGDVVHSYADLSEYLATGKAPVYNGPIE